MRSGKSFFNLTLYKKDLTRFWPVWVLYLVIWMFILPFNLILTDYANPSLRFSQKQVLDSIPQAGLALAVIFSLMAAMAVWSYLYNNRSTCLMHTLPMRREGLFLTNFLSGMTFLAGPNLVIFVLTLLAEAIFGCVVVGPLVMWFFAVTLMELFFFCFATFCAMFTGHILGLPAYYGILSVLPFGLVGLFDATMSRFVFGYDGVDGLYTLARWLTPVWNLMASLEVRRVEEIGAGMIERVHYEFPTLGYILVYALLGLALAVIGLIVYRRRHMERAGDAVTVGWVRPVFQYGVAFCCALAFGTLFFEIFRWVLPETAWTLLVLMLISGTVGYFLAKMILEKSFRVFYCWKGCLPFLAALIVLVGAMEFDLTGFERKVPDVKKVASVSVSGLYTRPYDAGQYINIVDCSDTEVIQAVLDLHRAVVDNKEFIEDNQNLWGEEQHEDGYYTDTIVYTGFFVSYHLKNGDTISRNYDGRIPVFAGELNDPQTVSGKYCALINMPQVIEDTYGLSDETADKLLDVTLSGYYFDDGQEGYETFALPKEAHETILNAVKADLAEGGIGRRYPMDDQERMNHCFVNDLTFVFYRPLNVAVVDGNPQGQRVESPTVDAAEEITVTLQTTSRHTLAALKQVGALEKPLYLFTQAQRSKATLARETNGDAWNDAAAFAEDIIGD